MTYTGKQVIWSDLHRRQHSPATLKLVGFKHTMSHRVMAKDSLQWQLTVLLVLLHLTFITSVLKKNFGVALLTMIGKTLILKRTCEVK